MKPVPIFEACEMLIPEPLLRAADDAERRKEDALARLEVKLDVTGKGADLEAMIGADLEYNGRHKWVR